MVLSVHIPFVEYLEDLPATVDNGYKPFADVYLAVALGCMIGNDGPGPVYAIDSDYLAGAMIELGVDITISAQDCELKGFLLGTWEEHFWECATGSVSGVPDTIFQCVVNANVETLYTHQGEFTVEDAACVYSIGFWMAGGGTLSEERLLPARYGNASN